MSFNKCVSYLYIYGMMWIFEKGSISRHQQKWIELVLMFVYRFISYPTLSIECDRWNAKTVIKHYPNDISYDFSFIVLSFFSQSDRETITANIGIFKYAASRLFSVFSSKWTITPRTRVDKKKNERKIRTFAVIVRITCIHHIHYTSYLQLCEFLWIINIIDWMHPFMPE